MRLPGNNAQSNREVNSGSGGQSSQPANDNQMDEMVSSAIDAFLGSSRQTYDEFLQNFTQLTSDDVTSVPAVNSSDDTPGCALSSSVSTFPRLFSLQSNIREGIIARSSTATGGGDTLFTSTNIDAEFPGRDEPPPVPPVFATDDDQLEEELLDGGIASCSGAFTPNAAVRNLQVDNFIGDEEDISDEEKGDWTSEKGSSNLGATNHFGDEDDIPSYQASFLQAPSKYSKSEKNQANKLQLTIDKAHKDFANISQQNLQRLSPVAASAEGTVASGVFECAANAGATTDWTRVTDHRHIPIKVVLRPDEEDLLDIIGDDVESDPEDAEQSETGTDLMQQVILGVSASSAEILQRNLDQGTVENEANAQRLIQDADQQSLVISQINDLSLSSRSNDLSAHGNSGVHENSLRANSEAERTADISDNPTSSEAASDTIITDSEIDVISQPIPRSSLKETEVDDESTPIIIYSDGDTMHTLEESEKPLVYDSDLDSCNVGEVDLEGATESLTESVTNIRELSYSAKPATTDNIPQTANVPEYDSSQTDGVIDDVQQFVLDEDFDYDNVTLTPKFNAEEMEYLRSFLPSSN